MIAWAFDGHIYIIWDEWNIGQAWSVHDLEVTAILDVKLGYSEYFYFHYVVLYQSLQAPLNFVFSITNFANSMKNCIFYGILNTKLE